MCRARSTTRAPSARRSLGELTFHQRALLLKALAQALTERKQELYDLSARAGATRADCRIDVDGGIGALFTYASKGRRELPNSRMVVLDGPVENLSKDGSFLGRHIYTRLPGVAVQINAFNFPVWGLLEKFAPAFLAGVPTRREAGDADRVRRRGDGPDPGRVAGCCRTARCS